MDRWRRVAMDLQARKRKTNAGPGQGGVDGDFVQLRVVRERRESDESRKALRRESVLTGADIRLSDATHVKAKRPSTAHRVQMIEKLRKKLFKAVDDNDVANVMLQVGNLKKHGPLTSELASHPETNENIWHYALSQDKTQTITYLLDTEDDLLFMSHHKIQRSGIQGKQNALHILIEKNDVDMVKRVLSKISSQEKKLQMMKTETAVSIQGQRPRCLSCLHLAAFYGYVELVDLFLDSMDANHLNKREDTALLWAARWSHDEVVNSLLDRGANPELTNDKGSTALHWAVRYEHAKTVELLLKKGKADPNTQRKLGLVAPLVVASAYGNNAIVQLLLSQPNCDVDIRIPGGESPIHHAAREGYIDVLTSLLERDAQPDNTDELGNTPLLLAAQNGHVELVYRLITLGANVFHRNHEGNDPWNYAIDSEDTDLLEVLLTACLDKGIDMTSRQPLCIAAGSGKCDKIEFLLKLRQDPLVKDIDGNTFLHFAAMNDRHNVIEKFHKSIPIDTQNNRGNTPLHIACSKGFDQTVKCLLKCKAKADVKNKQEETSLHVAAYAKHITADAVRELVEYTINMHPWESLNAKDSKGNNCLHVAGKFAKPDVIWEFRFVSFKDANNTPLHEAVRAGQPEALNMMLDIFETMKRDANINQQSAVRMETVLHLAVDEGLASCVKRLIDLGADLSVQDKDKNTVLHRLTQATVLNPRHLKRHLDMFDIIFDRVVKWWCIKKIIAYPEENNRTDYNALRRKACLYLINEKYNKKGLSVLALSFNVGAPEIISRLLLMPDVTMFKFADSNRNLNRFDVSTLIPRVNNALRGLCRRRRDSQVEEEVHTDTSTNTYRYMFDVSGLTPRTNNALQGLCGSGNASQREEEDHTDTSTGLGNNEVRLSGIEWLITQEAKSRATQILDLPTVKIIEKYYTSVVARTFAFLMVFHILYMSIFTYVGVDFLGKLRDDESAINASDPETLLLYVIVLVEPVILIIYILCEIIRSVISGDICRRSKLSRKRGIAYVISMISAYMYMIVGVVYAALIIAWIALFSVRYHYQDYVLAAALCVGWLLTITFTRGFKIFHYFVRMLHMILWDVLRFLFVYLFVLLAFGFAFHVLFQVSSDVVQDYPTPTDTLFLSFNMMIGMGELFDDTFSTNIHNAGRTVTYIKVFYLLYTILSTIILLNLLIAMMNDSYSHILKEQQVTWRIDSVSLGVEIERRFPARRLFPISVMQTHEAATKFPSSGIDPNAPDRWYVVIDVAEFEEYTRRQDVQSENTDELNARLEELENKASQMQAKTNATLKQINELLEKAVKHKSVVNTGDT